MEKAKSVTVTVEILSGDEAGETQGSTTMSETIEVNPEINAEGEMWKSHTKPALAAFAQEAMDKLKQKFLQGLVAILFALLFAFPNISLAETFRDVQTDQFCIGGTRAEKICYALATTSLNCASAAGTCTATNLIPAGSIVLGVLTRVTTTITGMTTISIGDGTTAAKWGSGIALTAGTTTTGTAYTVGSPTHYAAATSVVLTAVGGGADFTAGVVRISVIYITAGTAPSV